MKKMINHKHGFTLIELIMVIVMLGFLGMVAIPIYTDMTTRSSDTGRDGVVGGVRAGIATYHAGQNPPAYPAALDGIAINTACTAGCFGSVLGQGAITDTHWTKGASTTTYLYDRDGAGGAAADTYTYVQGTPSDGGKFTKT